MISTKGQVRSRALSLLDDDIQGTFTDVIFEPAFDEAWDALRGAFLGYQIPFIEQIVQYTLPPNTLSFSPSDAGIAGFGDLVELEERNVGTTDRYVHVWEKDKLSQRDPTDQLLEFVWRLDEFQTLGSILPRDLRITYWDTGASFPADDTDSIGVDRAITFLSKYAAAAMGPRKGYDELAAKYKLEAVGSRYDDGVIGGELFRLIQPMLRGRQRVPLAPKPYSVIRRRWQKRQPYIAANQPAGGGTSPAQFSFAAGTLTGTLDGTNPTFFLAFPCSTVVVYLNGLVLTPNKQYTAGANVITFLAPYIPQPGADILVQGWL